VQGRTWLEFVSIQPAIEGLFIRGRTQCAEVDNICLRRFSLVIS
jgi:hypothetical protein